MLVISSVLISFLALVNCHHYPNVDSSQQVRVRELYKSIVTDEYMPSLRPAGVNTTTGTQVEVQLRDFRVIHVDEQLGTFTFQAFARREWVDPRLAYNDSSVSYIPLRECRVIWSPDLYFLEGLETSTFSQSYHSNSARTVRVYPNGRVFHSTRVTQTIYCPALTAANGVGEVVCPLRVGSYGYYDDEIQVVLGEQGVTVAKAGSYPRKFGFGGVTVSPKCDEVNLRTADDDGHNHSCVQANVRFTRV